MDYGERHSQLVRLAWTGTALSQLPVVGGVLLAVVTGDSTWLALLFPWVITGLPAGVMGIPATLAFRNDGRPGLLAVTGGIVGGFATVVVGVLLLSELPDFGGPALLVAGGAFLLYCMPALLMFLAGSLGAGEVETWPGEGEQVAISLGLVSAGLGLALLSAVLPWSVRSSGFMWFARYEPTPSIPWILLSVGVGAVSIVVWWWLWTQDRSARHAVHGCAASVALLLLAVVTSWLYIVSQPETYLTFGFWTGCAALVVTSAGVLYAKANE